MYITIQLHDDPHLVAIEIDDVLVDRNLSSKLQPMRFSIPKDSPRQPFRFGLLSSEFLRPIQVRTRKSRSVAHSTLTRRFAPPSPSGRGNFFAVSLYATVRPNLRVVPEYRACSQRCLCHP